MHLKRTDAERIDAESPLQTQNTNGSSAGAKGFFKQHRKKLIAAVCVLIVAGIAFNIFRGGKKNTATSVNNYTEISPETRNITNIYSSTGTLSAANTYTVKSLVKGTVLTADFEVGDTIEKGTVLYTLDSSDVTSNVQKAQLSLEQAQRNYDEAQAAGNVKASISGTLVTLKVRTGDLVNAGQEIAVIRDDSTLLLSLQFPATDAAGFYIGQSAQVMMDSTFETLSGTVQSISGADTLSSGNMLVRTVTIAVNNAGSLTATQAATATINGVSALGSAHLSYQREQSVTASTSGTVSAVYVKEGASVSADTVLLALTSSELTKQLQNAADNLTTAQLQVTDSEKTLENYTITSPISGTVISKNIKVGDTVGSGTTSETMCIINDLSYLQMTLNVDELEILSIKVGQTVKITADAISDRTFTGTVTSVSTAGTTTGGTTTYPVTVRIDDTGDLLPGMNATAEITVASAENALTVPNNAVVRGNYVLITKDSPSASNAAAEMNAPDGYVYVKVSTGISDNDYIVIQSGITAQDTIAYDASTMAGSSSQEMVVQFGNASGDGFGGEQSGGPDGGGPGGGF